MFIVGRPLSIDVPDHAIERAEQRVGLSERQVLAYWETVAESWQDRLANIRVGNTDRLIADGAVWIVKRHSESGIRVMTVFCEGGR